MDQSISQADKLRERARCRHNTKMIPIMIPLKDTTCSIVAVWVDIFQNELMLEIYSKSLVRAISKVLLMKFS